MTTRPAVRLPGDKSITHRALAVAALASGESVIRRPLVSLDTRAMAGALRRLGIDISPLRANSVRVGGRGLDGDAFRKPRQTLHCGNSGTAARFLLGLLAGCPFVATITGDASLRRRPMRRVMDPLGRMGARFVAPAGDGLPVEVHGGRLRQLEYRSEVASAQLKTAALFAGVVGHVPIRWSEPVLSRDHTERMLRALGVDVESDGPTVTLSPPDHIPSFTVEIPGDPSSAAFLVSAALLASRDGCELRRVVVNPTRIGFITVLKRMGATIDVGNTSECMGEPVGDLSVGRCRLNGTTVEAREVPSLIDEIPVLATLAATAHGATVFRGVGELRLKESDRLGLLARNLSAVGVRCDITGDDLRVEGSTAPPRGYVETDGDHRMAMAFAVLDRVNGANIELSEIRSPAVSYPSFFDDLNTVAPRE